MGRSKGAAGRIKLGRVQFAIMQVLWDRGKANAQEISEALKNASPPIAHSTVQALLREFKEKGVADLEVRGRLFYYFPLVDRSEVTQDATRELIGRMFGGSPGALVRHVLREEKIPRAKLQELRELINAKVAKGGSR